MSMHERMESIADLYVAGGLGADERREADQHAAACASCASLLRDAREFSTWARGAISPDAPPADLEDRVIAHFRAAGQTKKRRFPVGKRILKISASVAAAVGLIFLGNMFNDRNGVPELKSLAMAASEFSRDFDGYISLESGKSGSPPAGNEFAYFFKRDLGGEWRNQTRSAGPSGGGGPADRWGHLGWNENEGVDTLNFRYSQDQTKNAPTTPPPPQEQLTGATFGLDADKANRKLQAGEVVKLNQELNDLQKAETQTLSKAEEALGELKAVEKDSKRESSPQDNRKIIRTGDVSLEVESYDATYTKLAELVAVEKGQISNTNTQKMANGKIQATVTIRIAPERFEAVIAKLKDFGTVQHQDIGSQDITKAYTDLETRLKSKEILAERLRKLLSEAKGNVKELMEVEVQLGATNEAIEQIKGEIKYYDNLVGLSTITLRISEKDLGRPFEYVQTLHSNIALTARDPNDVYAKAQKAITDAGGQVVDSKMTKQNDGASTGTIRGRVDAEKFPALRDALKTLGTVTNDTVNQQKTARGGHEGAPKGDAPLRKEQAIVDLTVSSPPLFVTRRSQILIETAAVESAYQNARRVIEAAGGKIVDGSLTGRADGMSAILRAQVDADQFADLVASLKTAGKVKNANVNHVLPAVSTDGAAPLLRERAEIELALVSPPQLIGEEHGILKTVRDTFANSWTGLLWSVEKLFVGLSLAGPWIAVLAAVWILWRRGRRRKAAQPSA
jgi:glycine cleavage system regulatory protein